MEMREEKKKNFTLCSILTIKIDKNKHFQISVDRCILFLQIRVNFLIVNVVPKSPEFQMSMSIDSNWWVVEMCFILKIRQPLIFRRLRPNRFSSDSEYSMWSFIERCFSQPTSSMVPQFR